MTDMWSLSEMRQKLGISTHVMGPLIRVGAREIAQIREAGITRIELCGVWATWGPHYHYRDSRQNAEIVAECERQGVEIVAVHGADPPEGLISTRDLYRQDERRREKAIEDTVELAKVMAGDLDARHLVTHCGILPTSKTSLGRILHQIEGLPVSILVENTSGDDGAYRLADCRRFVKEIGSPQFGIVMDIGHLWDPELGPIRENNPLTKKGGAHKEVQACGPYLHHLHLHDLRDIDHYPPFTGTILWGELFSALYQHGYAGTLNFEPGGFWEDTWARGLAEALGPTSGHWMEIVRMVASVPDRLACAGQEG